VTGKLPVTLEFNDLKYNFNHINIPFMMRILVNISICMYRLQFNSNKVNFVKISTNKEVPVYDSIYHITKKE
jgi:hypothetical protein